MRRKSFLKHAPQSDTMSLQITSMADVFIIVMVFLLKSYASGTLDVTPSNGVTLPSARHTDGAAQALKVEVSENSILVENQPVAGLHHATFDPGDLGAGGVSKALTGALQRERARELLIARSNPDVKFDSRITVVADQHVPYTTIKTVLASAATQGFTDFKLAVAAAQ